MKIKTEKIFETTSNYLKKRNFESENPSQEVEIKDAIEKLEHAGVLGLVSPSLPNAFTFSATSSQHSLIEQQFVRLKAYILEASEPCRTELLNDILFPLFVYLYLELTACDKKPGELFYSKYHRLFNQNRLYEQTLRQLRGAAGENVSRSLIHNLRNGKYNVRLSELSVNYFLRYLQTSSNPSLLQIFNNYIEVEIDETSGSGLFTGFSDSDLMQSSDSCSSEGGVLKLNLTEPDCNAEELQKVKDVINRVRNGQLSMPSVCVYNVVNSFNGLSTARVNHESTILACGFEDSVIKLWRLSAKQQNSSELFGIKKNYSCTVDNSSDNVILACDYDNDENRNNSEVHSSYAGGAGMHFPPSRQNSGGEWNVLRGHRGCVYDIAFTHDSSHIFSVGEDCRGRLWDVQEGRTIALYHGHHWPVWCVEFSAQSIYFATGSFDGTARVWTTECTYPIRSLVGHTRSIDAISFHPNCSYVATASTDCSIRMWQINDASIARVFLQHITPVTALVFAPNGKLLASGSADGEIIVWDLAAGKSLWQITCHNTFATESATRQSGELVMSLNWSQDSLLLISASRDGCIRAHQIAHNDVSDLFEVGNVNCNLGDCNITLISSSLSKHNYITAVTALRGER